VSVFTDELAIGLVFYNKIDISDIYDQKARFCVLLDVVISTDDQMPNKGCSQRTNLLLKRRGASVTARHMQSFPALARG
jgi:hypothetical protein